jgi:predicted DNA-binding transcriptional regulator AlpA
MGLHSSALPEPEPLLDTQDLASLLGVSVSTLLKWRSSGDGPPFLKLRRTVRYDPKSLQDWLLANAKR